LECMTLLLYLMGNFVFNYFKKRKMNFFGNYEGIWPKNKKSHYSSKNGLALT
jgi:hypothetical protein